MPLYSPSAAAVSSRLFNETWASLAAYTTVAGSPAVAAGKLTLGLTGFTITRTGVVLPADQRQVMQITTGTTTTVDVGVVVRQRAGVFDSLYVDFNAAAGSGSVIIYGVTGGSANPGSEAYTSLASIAVTGVLASTSYWLDVYVRGTIVTARLSLTDPTLTTADNGLFAVSHTLAAGTNANFWAAVRGLCSIKAGACDVAATVGPLRAYALDPA